MMTNDNDKCMIAMCQDVKRYMCHMCGKRYTRDSDLTVHIRTHT